MSWKSGLRRAAFRGVEFHVRDRGHKTGRAIVNHEYPKRDENFAEDMGRDTRKWTVDAYVIGDDYMSRRDRLIDVCEREGAGSYVDHWGRSSTVRCEGCDLKETSEEGRMARFQLSFIAAGSMGPTASVAGIAAVLGAASGVLSSSVVSAARNLVVGQSAGSIAGAAGVAQSSLPPQVLRRAAQSVLGR